MGGGAAENTRCQHGCRKAAGRPGRAEKTVDPGHGRLYRFSRFEHRPGTAYRLSDRCGRRTGPAAPGTVGEGGPARPPGRTGARDCPSGNVPGRVGRASSGIKRNHQANRGVSGHSERSARASGGQPSPGTVSSFASLPSPRRSGSDRTGSGGGNGDTHTDGRAETRTRGQTAKKAGVKSEHSPEGTGTAGIGGYRREAERRISRCPQPAGRTGRTDPGTA